MAELVIILAVLVILTLWIVGHNVYLWRTDVLTGNYISRRDSEPAPAGEDTEAAGKVAAEERRTTRAFLFGWNSDQRESEPEDQTEAGPIDLGDSAAASITPAKRAARRR
jgi:uncharacterized membrane protein